jgi:NTP pyrophosphatase (non-canonical NTP hydrolase)
MQLNDAQTLVDDWISQWDSGYWSTLSNLARLTEELGELARAINLRDGDKPTKSDRDTPSKQALTKEFGDVLFNLIVLANSMDVDLAEALQQALDSYNVRDADRH